MVRPGLLAAALAAAALAAVLLLLPLVGTARAGEAAAPLPLDPEARAWVEARIAHARGGRREIVRVPLVRAGLGWGCRCPPFYLGENPFMNPIDRWIAVTTAPGLTLPPGGRPGWVQVAEGYFTGATRKLDLRGRDGVPQEWLYTLDEFHVMALRPARGGADGIVEEDRRLHLLLSGPEAARRVTPLADGRPWLVVAASEPLEAPGGEARAEKLRRTLVQAGLGGAEVLDSRQTPRLHCCYRVVVAGRFASREQADAAVTTARARGHRAYVKQGF
jgi:hypothetical protein